MPTPKEFNVLSGMTANVFADLNQFTHIEQHSLKVPANAVFAANNQALDAQERSVWIFDPKTSTVQQRAVTIGKLTGQGLEIKSGIKDGEQIVTAGVQQLRAGQQVRPWLRERGL
jgi:multidrug efflux pump subunit AcrA (membrane-fusion protein)